jgi:hypothetical protein
MAKFGTYGFAPVLWARNPHKRTALYEGPHDEVVIILQGSRFEPRYCSATSRDQSCSTSRSRYHVRCVLDLNGERRPPQVLPGPMVGVIQPGPLRQYPA